MALSISPAVIVKEIDATASVPAIFGQRAAIAGVFNWGPVGVPTLTSSETELVRIFWKPTNQNPETFFSAANFLSYSSAGVYVNRADNGATKATASDYFEGKYPGALGNSLGVSYVTESGYSKVIAPIGGAVGDIDYASKVASISLVSDNGSFIKAGDILRIGNDTVGYQSVKVSAVSNGGTDPETSLFIVNLTFEKSFAVAESDVSLMSIERLWEYHSLAGKAPAENRLHIVVYDRTGLISGAAGTALETFIDASLEPSARSDGNESIFYKNLIETSRWVTATSSTITDVEATNNLILDGAVDGDSEDNVAFSKIALAYDPYRNAEEYNVFAIIQGKAIGGGLFTGLSNYIVDNIVTVRKDCRAFLSPAKQASVTPVTVQDKLNEITKFRSSVNSSSYWHMDSGYKQQYDKYNEVYRWIPLNADCAGSYSRVEPWEVGAGYENGIIKNVHKLALNPNKDQRDVLFAADINPVMSETGFGTLIFGDKTGAGTGSSFSRMNVRGLFIYLQKEIANASKILFFQFNDTFTQTRFKNMVEPKLRMVQGRRGIIDFRVIADGGVNTADVIDANTFRAQIFVKPARSINFIGLDFISTPTGIEFDEIMGLI